MPAKKERIKLECAECHKIFERASWEANRREGGRMERGPFEVKVKTLRFCSKGCQQKAASWYNPKRFQRSRVRQMADFEAAWLAALIDGEGAIIFPQSDAQKKGAVKKGMKAEWARIVIGMTCYEILAKALELTGAGKIHNKTTQAAHYKRQWVWAAYGANAREIARQCLPWLILKREKALKVCALYLDEQQMKEIAAKNGWVTNKGG